MTRVSTALVMHEPKLISPWEDDVWLVGVTFQLVESGGDGLFWLASPDRNFEDNSAFSLERSIPDAVAESLVIFASVMVNGLDISQLVRDAAEENSQPRRFLAHQCAKKLEAQTRIGFVLLDECSTVTGHMVEILNKSGIQTHKDRPRSSGVRHQHECRRTPMIESTLLITPELNPSAPSIMRGLLRAQRVSTIVVSGQPDAPKALKKHPEFWVPTDLSSHIQNNTPLFQATLAEASTVIKTFPKQKSELSMRDKLYVGKLPYELESLMINRGLIQKSSVDPTIYDVKHKDLIPIVLAIFGRNIANGLKDDGWVCSFGTTVNARRALAAKKGNPEGEIRAALLTVYEVPEPHPEAKVQDILDFREKESRLFDKYFKSIDEVRKLLEMEVGPSGDLESTIRDGIRETDRRLIELRERDAPFKQLTATAGRAFRNPATLVVAGTSAAVMVIDAAQNEGFLTNTIATMGLVTGAIFTARKGWAGSAYLNKAVTARVLAPF